MSTEQLLNVLPLLTVSLMTAAIFVLGLHFGNKSGENDRSLDVLLDVNRTLEARSISQGNTIADLRLDNARLKSNLEKCAEVNARIVEKLQQALVDIKHGR